MEIKARRSDRRKASLRHIEEEAMPFNEQIILAGIISAFAVFAIALAVAAYSSPGRKARR